MMDDTSRPWRQAFQSSSMDLSRHDVLVMVQSFIEAFNDGSKQIAKNNALSELKSRCQSMQFVAHFHALPAPVFSPVLDIVSTVCVDSNDHDSLRDDLVALLFDVVGGAACVGYPTPPFAKALSTLVHSVVHAIVGISDVDLDASFALHLQTLAACLRGNVGVRLFVSELPTRKELVRTLALLLNRTDDASILIHAMSVLACLVLQEPMGRKLFQPKNVAHALTLVLSIVDNNPGTAHASSMLMTTRLDSSACWIDTTVPLHMASVNLVLDLAAQPWILSQMEIADEMHQLLHIMLPRLHMQETIPRLHVALHFLHGVASMSYRLRKAIGAKCPPLATSMAGVLHPSPVIAIAATKFFVALFADDKPLVQTLLDATSSPTAPSSSSATTSCLPDATSTKILAPLQPLLIGMFRTLHATITHVVRNSSGSHDHPNHHVTNDDDDNPMDGGSPAYEHAVWICLLLVQLGADARVVTLSVPLINLSQLVGLSQREASYHDTLPLEARAQFTPRFSLGFVTLLGTLVLHDDMDEDLLRDCHAALHHPAVALVLARGLCQTDDKAWTLRVLSFVRRLVGLSTTKVVQLHPLADALFAIHQKSHDMLQTWVDRVAQRDAAVQLASKQVERVTAELDLVKMNANDERVLSRTEHARLQKELDVQRTTHEHVLESLTVKMETQLGRVKAHCDGLHRQVMETTDALAKKKAQLQDSRVQRGQLDQDNHALQRKLLVLEMRLDELGQANVAATADVDRVTAASRQMQTELEAMSEAYAAQSGDLVAAHEANVQLKQTLNLQQDKHETLYRQLVLLAKAHQQQSDDLHRMTEERDVATRDLQEARTTLDDMHAHVEDQETRLHTHKEHMAELERAVVRYEQSVAEEQARSSTFRHDLDTLRHHHGSLQVYDVACWEGDR
ncbi:hypothetical protein, variant 3 [Aphanomyces astaci]|uniref:CIP2A N-terminal domain-containing protein n=1 Tax=Aphanomyces astaci TaxID=112090 RepID=W4GB63_APHAT|nr:hypothetical protein, variant 2 [Aphanomyces astaci]XP_009834307.1 hypothetical protein, variant 3 [Aphanomyces astaci]ETV76182.1 hypothetical protein, variant 2 [Aphanomyces astaci]ETV76183.1 hypothetical protein, variant 3 [Aphanomyces astaci]|eukprot:XP_009834306.1 hypothetical protein, variant 2 [Aphanomyces astaci]